MPSQAATRGMELTYSPMEASFVKNGLQTLEQFISEENLVGTIYSFKSSKKLTVVFFAQIVLNYKLNYLIFSLFIEK